MKSIQPRRPLFDAPDAPSTPPPAPIPARADLPADATWDLSPLFPSEDAWEAEFKGLDALLAPVLACKDHLSSPAEILALFSAEEALDRSLERLYTYAHLAHDVDTAAPAPLAREARIRSRYAEIAAACAWITPALLANDPETIRAWQLDPALAPYRRRIEKLLRNKPHVLSAAEETLLASASEVLSASEETYSIMTNADLTFPDLVPRPENAVPESSDEFREARRRREDAVGPASSDGNAASRNSDTAMVPHFPDGAPTLPDSAPLPLTEGTYRTYLESPSRPLRKAAFTTLFTTYSSWKNTLASTLSATVKSHVFDARARSFPSARAAALHDDEVPESVYDALIDAARAALPAFRRYLDLRRRVLALPDLDMFDLYAPLVPSAALSAPPETARQWVLDACEPLGPEYAALLQTAFSSRWIDWPENRGKQSGAYSSGCYDSPPYLLLNHHDRLDDAFTLAHELGHSMHTALANRAQPHATASYPIFLAEIASTVNELLLTRLLLSRAPSPSPLRAHLLNHLCDSFKGTVFRQTMFAEFERDIHAMEERGEPLTAESLSAAYSALNAAYYPSLSPHPLIAWEWCRIPHFYYDFYVYKYATSFCAALVFSRRVASRDPAAVSAYLDLLRSGGSLPPLLAVQRAGVDLSSPATFAEAFDEFSRTLDLLETALPAP